SMPAPKTLAATREIVIPRLPCRESPAVDIELQLVVRGVVAVKAEFVRAGNAAVVGFAEVRVLGHDRVPVATRNVQDFQADRNVEYRFVAEHRVVADTDEIVAEFRSGPLVTAVDSRDFQRDAFSFVSAVGPDVEHHAVGCSRPAAPS